MADEKNFSKTTPAKAQQASTTRSSSSNSSSNCFGIFSNSGENFGTTQQPRPPPALPDGAWLWFLFQNHTFERSITVLPPPVQLDSEEDEESSFKQPELLPLLEFGSTQSHMRLQPRATSEMKLLSLSNSKNKLKSNRLGSGSSR
ncbi:hypothetical protein T4E_5219 [Trichinella pseudospiralis]|uniref:Uncharacterized protein n=1 Tax=Trichinella pseudospiralis TaxID=6337 RepID=A0A0V0Y4Q7_TRIPS|nr:hypothetical protein T4E_5219 [Trichinella pseudospiralis]